MRTVPQTRKDVPMALVMITADQFPEGTSRYTLAMAKCLCEARTPATPLHDDVPLPSPSILQALINLVQGRMVEYLADRICREFEIGDLGARTRIVTVLLGVFSDELFALFRTKITQQPSLVVDLARRIVRKEVQPHHRPTDTTLRQPVDRLFPAIFRKYFDYRNLGALLRLMETEAHIQRIILESMLVTHLANPAKRERIMAIMEDDEEGIVSSLFMRYIKEGAVEYLERMVESGAWRDDQRDRARKLALLRGRAG